MTNHEARTVLQEVLKIDSPITFDKFELSQGIRLRYGGRYYDVRLMFDFRKNHLLYIHIINRTFCHSDAEKINLDDCMHILGSSLTVTATGYDESCVKCFSESEIIDSKSFFHTTYPAFGKAPTKLDENVERRLTSILIKIEDIRIEPTMSDIFTSPQKSLCEDIKTMYESKECCDVIIKVQKEELKAHKFILICRSKVFKAMFCANMKENIDNEVIIDDIEPEVFKEVLLYMYTGEVSDLKNLSLEIARAADKYELEELVRICHDYVWKNMSREHVLAILKYGLYQDNSKLIKKAVEFVVKNKPIFSPEDLQSIFENAEFSRLLLDFARSVLYA